MRCNATWCEEKNQKAKEAKEQNYTKVGVLNVYSFLYKTNIQNKKYLYSKLVLTTLTKQACI